jgi:hypothetical protein
MEPVPVDRRQTIYVPQPNLVNPYAENITFRDASMDPRRQWMSGYIGTLAEVVERRVANHSSQFRHQRIERTFDAVASRIRFPAVEAAYSGRQPSQAQGSGRGKPSSMACLQTAGMHMRESTQFRSNPANGKLLRPRPNPEQSELLSASNPGLPPSRGVNGAVLRLTTVRKFLSNHPQFTKRHDGRQRQQQQLTLHANPVHACGPRRHQHFKPHTRGHRTRRFTAKFRWGPQLYGSPRSHFTMPCYRIPLPRLFRSTGTILRLPIAQQAAPCNALRTLGSNCGAMVVHRDHQ